MLLPRWIIVNLVVLVIRLILGEEEEVCTVSYGMVDWMIMMMDRKLLMMWKEIDKRGKTRNYQKR